MDKRVFVTQWVKCQAGPVLKSRQGYQVRKGIRKTLQCCQRSKRLFHDSERTILDIGLSPGINSVKVDLVSFSKQSRCNVISLLVETEAQTGSQV